MEAMILMSRLCIQEDKLTSSYEGQLIYGGYLKAVPMTRTTSAC